MGAFGNVRLLVFFSFQDDNDDSEKNEDEEHGKRRRCQRVEGNDVEGVQEPLQEQWYAHAPTVHYWTARGRGLVERLGLELEAGA